MQGKRFRQCQRNVRTLRSFTKGVRSIASQQAPIQFGNEHLQFDRTGSANIYPAPHRVTPTVHTKNVPEIQIQPPRAFFRGPARLPQTTDRNSNFRCRSLPGSRRGLAPTLLLLGLIGGGVCAATDADTKPIAKFLRGLKTSRPMSSPSYRRTIALAWPRRLPP
jgi:hypothetical protein